MAMLAMGAWPATEANAAEGNLPGGGQYSAKTIWTDVADLTEIARFPLSSSNPSFIVYVESLHPGLSACTREQDQLGQCDRPNLCEIYLDVRDDLQPVQSLPIQPDPSTVLIAAVDEDTREGNGPHMLNHWDFGVLVVAGGANAEALWFHGPVILDYADGNQQCMAGVRVEYTPNVKNLFNQWRP
jgi:hypothetical protein